MLTESKIILPIHGNDMHPLDAQLATVEDILLQQFGGYNCTVGKGAWRNDKGKVYYDMVQVYSVAADWSLPHNSLALRQIARYASVLMEQESVYMCLDGQVEFVVPYDK